MTALILTSSSSPKTSSSLSSFSSSSHIRMRASHLCSSSSSSLSRLADIVTICDTLCKQTQVNHIKSSLSPSSLSKQYIFSNNKEETRLNRKRKNPAYGQHSALLYMCDSKVPILYHESWSIPWVLFWTLNSTYIGLLTVFNLYSEPEALKYFFLSKRKICNFFGKILETQ